ncbi:MAG TPA: glycosyltransferase family 39 protein [Pirellulales bacterium]|nr:glycosyltransferase family 39 protein [Pirellulales bacterium]
MESSLAAVADNDSRHSAWSAPPAVKLVARLAISLAIAAAIVHETCLIFDLTRRTYGEGPILAMCERMRAEPVSASWMRELPYGLSCYGPAYYWVTNLVVRLSGWQHSFIPGRIVALACGLATAALAGLTARRHTRSSEIGLLAASMFLVSLPFVDWLPFARVDTLAVMFSAAAYWAVGRDVRSIVVAAVCVAAGSLAKPTAALTAVPIFAHLLATRRYREAAWFAAWVVSLGVAAWAAVQWATGGFFLTAVLLGNINPMSLWKGYATSYEFLPTPLATGAFLTATWLVLSSPRRFMQSLFSLGFAINFAISALLCAKRGAEINYFLEPALLASLAIAVDGLPRLLELDARRAMAAMAVLAALIAVPSAREVRAVYRSLPARPTWFALVRQWLADEPADVGLLADAKVIDMVLEAGHRPLVNDPYLYTMMVGNGTLESSPLMERMRDGRIKWLFFHRTLPYHLGTIERDTHSWPPEVIEALPRFYEPVAEEQGLYIYRHRKYGRQLASSPAAREF